MEYIVFFKMIQKKVRRIRKEVKEIVLQCKCVPKIGKYLYKISFYIETKTGIFNKVISLTVCDPGFYMHRPLEQINNSNQRCKNILWCC